LAFEFIYLFGIAMQKPLLISLLFPCILFGQGSRNAQQAEFFTKIVRATGPVVVDGKPNEAAWAMADSASNFWMKWPRDGGPAPQQTLVRCLYDQRYLYVSALCYDSSTQNVVQSLKRDVGYWDSDGFALVLDPMNTGNNGYFFGVNVAGAQTDGLIATGTEDTDFNWDNTWLAETATFSDHWAVEFAIPLRILRYKQGQSTWGINFIRNDLGNNIYSVWARVPFQFDGLDLGYTGALTWDEPPAKNKGNYNWIPYASTSLSRDYEENDNFKLRGNAGLDAKIGVGTGMNLDVTVNPDFSQVEIDQQVVNLTRFDVQLPEKRTFFLENGDIFGNFGIPPLRPFFSRRIGLNNDGEPLPILGGLRLSGNLNPNTRLGIMTMQIGAKDSMPGQNNTAIALKQNVLGRSTVSGYFLNKQEFGKNAERGEGFSRNAGIELLFISNNNAWFAWATHHHSIKPQVSGSNWWGNYGFAYNTRRLSWVCDLSQIGENYYADQGFEPRIENFDVVRDTVLRIPYNYVFNEITFKFFPKKKNSRINYAELGGPILLVLNDDGSVNEFSPMINYELNFKNTSLLNIGIQPVYSHLPVSFKLDDEEDLTKCPALPAGVYQFVSSTLEWNSDYRQAFQWSLGSTIGQYYNGEQLGLQGRVSYRFRQFAVLNLEAEYNRLQFPSPYCSVEFFNITPRLEVFFAKNLWWTTFLQYNTQSDNFNINSRLQWRYRPMSDVFLVYTDNYAVKEWGVKNKALVLKVNYWF
jgi:hypothetical protein